MTGALALLTAMLVLGVVIAVTPSTAGPPIAAPPIAARTIAPGAVRRRGARFVLSCAIGVAVFATSGWIVPAAVVGIGAFWAIGGWQRRQRSSEREIVRLDALASWIENVRDVLMAGEQPVGAIRSTVGACHPVLRPHVRRLAAGLGRQDADLVFRRFADDIDDPLADLVAAGLAIAIRRGARTVPVLTALADQTRQQVDRRRLIEAERAPTRREVQALTAIMGLLIVALLLLGRSSYLDAYDETGGQVFLAAALVGYVALLVRVQKLAAFPRPSRFLTASGRIAGVSR